MEMTRCWKCGHDESTIHFNGQNCPTDGREMNNINNPCGHTGFESNVCEICGYPDPSKMIAALKQQIENLKCCGNCKHIAYDEQTGELSCENDHYPFRVKGRCDNWIFDGRTRGR